MKAQWDWRVACLTRPGTQLPDPEGLVALLTALEEKCGRNGFRLVFPGDRRQCFIAYREPGGNGGFAATLGTLAKAANLKLEPATAVEWPEPKHVLQLAEPRLEAEVSKIIRDLISLGPVALYSQGGQMLKIFAANGDGAIPQAAAFRSQKSFADGSVFWPGPFCPRGSVSGGVTLTDLAAGFWLEQFEPELSPVSVQVGTAEETGSPVFVDAGVGPVLILGPENSTIGPRIGYQLALKAVQKKQIVVVVQPRKGMDLGPLSGVQGDYISTQMDDETIDAWKSRVLVGPGLSVVQGHPGGDALEQIHHILEGLWASAQAESANRGAGWSGVTLAINDFLSTTSESKEAPGKQLPPFRHDIYNTIAQMAAGGETLHLVLLTRPSVLRGVDSLWAIRGNFQVVRLPTAIEGFPPGEGFSHDRLENEDHYTWLHKGGEKDRVLVFGPEKRWIKTKLEMVEPEVEVIAEPEVRVLRPDEVRPHRWPTREQRQPAAQPPSVTVEALAASVSATDLERLLKAKGILPLRPHERDALEDLKKPKPPVVEAVVEVAAEPKPAVSPAPPAKAPPQQAPPMKEVTAAAGVGRPRPEEPKPEPRLTRSEEKLLRKRGILDLAGGLLERDLEPSQIVQLCKAGVPRWRFEAFLEKRISRKELLAK